MTRQNRSDFFSEVKEHSQIKLTAIRRYLRPWAAAVGHQRGVGRIWVVDGFAGTGVYDTGQLGSPALALEEATWTNAQERKYRMACILVESDRKNFGSLSRVTSRYEGVERIAVRGSFWEKTNLVAELVQDEPCFLFVDPFGLGDLDFDGLVSLLNRLKQVDVMVNLASPVAKRLESGHAGLVSKAVGGEGWSVDTVSDTFRIRLRERAQMLSASLPVSTALGEFKYEVILGARHPRALELWNDEIASKEAAILNGSDGAAKIALVAEAKEAVQRFARGRQVVRRDRLIAELSLQRCGEAHSRTYKAAIESLISEGAWVRDPGPVGSSLIRF